MTDINNNLGTEKLNIVGNNLNFDSNKINFGTQKNYSDKEIKNLDNAHSTLVGRSMIKKVNVTKLPHFDGATLNNIKGDIAELNENFSTIKKANAIFEGAIAKGYSYDKAAAMAREFANSMKVS